MEGVEELTLNRCVHRYSLLLEAAKQGEECFAGHMGWLDPAKLAGEAILDQAEALAHRICNQADILVIVGVGGSLNGARAAIEALQRDGLRILYMGNTLSGHTLARTLETLKGTRFCVNCIAKNFETLEPGVSFRLLRKLLREQHGMSASDYIYVTGTPGSRLEELCREYGYTFLTFPQNVGGRYSVLSMVGLLPMAAAGIDIRAMVEGARSMRERLLTEPAGDSIALRYACLRNLLYEKGCRIELLACFEPQYQAFFKWWVQLFAESEGKNGKGLFPAGASYSEELHSLGQYVQEGSLLMFETFLTVREADVCLSVPEDDVEDGFSYLNGSDFQRINQAAMEATRSAHAQRMPCLTLELERTDARSFGELFYFFEFACYLSGRILGVNPFDQPGVEAYKCSMFDALGKNVQTRQKDGIESERGIV